MIDGQQDYQNEVGSMKEQKKKRGRPTLDKTTRAYTIDKDIAVFLNALPEGDRSRFVNDWLRQHPDVPREEKQTRSYSNEII